MTGERRKFTREGEERRREALISAALELVAEGGIALATVRSIAERAGVTPGLIRHYFQSKEELTRAAYRALMDRMTAQNLAVLDSAPPCAMSRLAAFVAASLRPPVVDAGRLSRWAGFIQTLRRDPAMRDIHEATYLHYRDLLAGLIADLPDPPPQDRIQQLSTACNGLIDGLWLEGCALPENFGPDELSRIGVAGVGAILGRDLTPFVPPPADDAGKEPA
jgi:AcrR family transcriptional regulator